MSRRTIGGQLPQPELLTLRDVAERLRLSRATVYRLCERGELPHLRVSNAIRVVPEDLDVFLAAQRKGGIVGSTLPPPSNVGQHGAPRGHRGGPQGPR